MKVLPPRTQPPRERLTHRHEPTPCHYRKYRPCLRWDFGFTCALCLLHEADFQPLGIKGSGLMSAEHVVMQSESPSDRDSYTNLVYACRYCNSKRIKATGRHEGAMLLDPTVHPWADHFHVTEDHHLQPFDGDADAAYTHDVYRLDLPLKRAARKERERVMGFIPSLRAAPARIRRMRQEAMAESNIAERRRLLSEAKDWSNIASGLMEDILRYPMVPLDADPECVCADKRHCRVPACLEEQAVEVDMELLSNAR